MASQIRPQGIFSFVAMVGEDTAHVARDAARQWPRKQKLPHPAKIGLPSGGLASPAAVHAALGGSAARPWWRFW